MPAAGSMLAQLPAKKHREGIGRSVASMEFVGQIPAVNRPNPAVNLILFQVRPAGETLPIKTMKRHLFLALMFAVEGGTMAQTPPNYHLFKKPSSRAKAAGIIC